MKKVMGLVLAFGLMIAATSAFAYGWHNDGYGHGGGHGGYCGSYYNTPINN